MRNFYFLLPMVFAVTAHAEAIDRKDVAYARPGGKDVLLDLHVPDGAGPFPAAILVHGGGFDEGSKSTNVRPLFEPLAGAGFAWFSIDYRMAPQFRFPQAAEDVASAIRWVKANAREYRVDPSKIVLIGESAGGLLVNWAGTHETADTRVAAVVDIYGPVDYARLAELRRDHPERFNMTSINRHMANGGSIRFFGVEQIDPAGLAKLRSISPLFAVHKGMPPFLCIHGTKDDQVVYEQSTSMCETMRKAGVACELITIEGGGHGMSGWRAPEMQHWKPEMIAWLNKTLGMKKDGGMTHHARGTFDVKLAPQAPEEKGDAALGRMTIDKQFHGDLEASSKGQMLTAGTEIKGSAGYVAIERVTGKLNGRSGSFILQHNATMTRGTPELSITVVPDSGSGELAGIAGKMAIVIEGGKHSYEFAYTLGKD